MNSNFTIYNDNCFNVLAKLPDKSVDHILADPPYGTTTISWDKVLDFKRMWLEIERVIKPGGNIILFASQPFTSLMVCSKIDWFQYELIWNKNKCGSPGLAKYRPMKTHENILLFCNEKTKTYNPIIEKGNPYFRECKDKDKGYGTGKNTHKYGFGKQTKLENHGTRNPKSILHCPRNFSAQQTVHPTQKPTNLLNWLIMTYSNPDETILDFTMGSGSTGVSCMETGRKFIGIELETQYFEIAKNRIENANKNSVAREDEQLTTQNDFLSPPSSKKTKTASNNSADSEFFQSE